MQAHHWVFLGSLLFVLAACANSARLTRRHLRTPGPEDVRTCTVRILLMVPVYSIESWLALVLRASDFNKVAALLRKGYESVVVLSFAELLLAWLGGPEALAERLEPERCKHLPPLSLVLPSWAPAPRFLRRLLLGVLQNAFCSMVVTPLALISWCTGGASPFVFNVAQTCCIVVMNASQFFAVYCVVTFYHANRGPLAPLRPVQKLLSIKVLVFCLFWQEAAVRVAEHAGVFDGWSAVSDHWSVQQVAWGLLNCVICVEMFLLSLVHGRLYPPGETARAPKWADSLSEASTSASADAAGSDSEISGTEAWVPEKVAAAATAAAVAAASAAAAVELASASPGLAMTSLSNGGAVGSGVSCLPSRATLAATALVAPVSPTTPLALPPPASHCQQQAGFDEPAGGGANAGVSCTGCVGAGYAAGHGTATGVPPKWLGGSGVGASSSSNNSERKWEVCRRFLSVLDVRDIPRFYDSLAALESRQPDAIASSTPDSEASEMSGLRNRPRSSTLGASSAAEFRPASAPKRTMPRTMLV